MSGDCKNRIKSKIIYNYFKQILKIRLPTFFFLPKLGTSSPLANNDNGSVPSKPSGLANNDRGSEGVCFSSFSDVEERMLVPDTF